MTEFNRLVAPPSSAHATSTMRANRRRDTKPEIAIRSRLHRLGLRFRVDLPIRTSAGIVRPDIAFTRTRLAVFIDGCYWHGCPQHGEVPKSNRRFWLNKFDSNRRRDAAQTKLLKSEGWKVIRIWEHEEAGEAVERVRAALP